MSFIHTKIMKKVKEILQEDEEYKYLDISALEKLREYRKLANKAGILEKNIVILVEERYSIFPWIGTKEMLALSYALKQEGIQNTIYFKSGIPIFIDVRTEKGIKELELILKKIKNKDINKYDFELPELIEKPGKYNYFIPKDLLRKQFIADCIDVDEMKENL